MPGTVLVVALGAVAVAAVLSRPDVGQLGVLAPLASILTGVGVFRWLHRVARAGTDDTATATDDTATATDDTRAGSYDAPNRRRFLVSAVAVAAGAGAAGAGGALLGNSVDVEASRRAVARLTPQVAAPGIPAGADFVQAGTPTFVTANRDFYRIDTALVVPRLRAQDWRLRVHGMVERELVLSYDDLRAGRLVEKTITLTCVSNEVGGPYISTSTFVGVPLRDVLNMAGVKPGADQLVSRSVDSFSAGTPVEVVLEPNRDALLALGMNGEPLPAEHGFPVRMVVPGLYGYVSATKWLVDLELSTFAAFDPYWVRRGWARKAPIKTESRIDRPSPSAEVPRDKFAAGKVVVAGVAWAQHTGVDRVEVRADGGSWQQAELATEVNLDTWRMWRTELDLPAGRHTVECRATDRSGYTQTGGQAPPVPDGATGWHSVSFTVPN
jgi:DMSO/TMAO reductase YedYZ molybdopterin-dependent catalytic subunit